MVEEITVGQYRLLNILQKGQNSEVWEVTDSHRHFVMKLILPEKIDDAEQRRMLRHEAAVGMKLDHPSIIRILSYSRDRRNPHILMEYFPSKNMKLQLISGDFESAIKPNLRRIIRQTAGALEYFHDKNWVHRDVKPDNILCNRQGDVRLIDFALAVRAASTFSRLFSRRGKTAGTRSYMSPEQIRGLPLDRRADIYSFGVMLYEVVAGKLPFIASTSDDLFRKHLRADMPSISSERNVTPEFQELLARMLAKKPSNRPQSMAEFSSEFRNTKIFTDEVIEDDEYGGMMR